MIRTRSAPWLAALLLAVVAAQGPPSRACTTFCLKDEGRILFGKNYDWNVSGGMLVVNQRGVRKDNDATPSSTPHSWISRYGSVTFNQYGREFPNGGMNEKGLVVELMWLDGSRYPEADGRGSVGCLQWIQYQLDTAATVAEVLASDQRIRIDSPTPIHYLVADAAGAVATVEFLDGRLVAHTGEDLPVAALANSTYDDSLAYLRRLRSEGSRAPGGPGSLARFARAAGRVEAFDGQPSRDPVGYAFRTLDSVAQGGHTQWSIVYDVERRTLHYRTRINPAIRSLSLKGLDLDCGTSVLAVDLHEGPAGDVRSLLAPWTEEANLRLIRASLSQTRFTRELPDEAARAQAAYPASTSCAR